MAEKTNFSDKQGFSQEPPMYSGAGPASGGYYPPPPSYEPMVTQPGVTVMQPGVTVVHSGGAVVGGGYATVIMPSMMGSKPASTQCRSCQAEIVTRVELKSTIRTHLMAGLLCLLGCWCCVCFPYCIDSCQNAEHYCPNCGAYIGSSHN